MDRNATRRLAPGFTIVELLTVIAIIALLLGMLLPALSGAQRRSFKSREMNALRQVGIAWNLYANSSADAALPGYVPAPVQDRWRVVYELPDKSPVPQDIAAPWTWRLLPYLDYNHDTVHAYRGEAEFEPVSMSRTYLQDVNGPEYAEAMAIAEEPAFGYNAFYVGGWWEMVSDSLARPRFYDATADLDNDGDVAANEKVNVISRSVGSIRRSSDLVVFASSSYLAPGLYRKFPNNQPGYHLVVPPVIGDHRNWSIYGSTGPSGPNVGFAQAMESMPSGGSDPNTVLVTRTSPAPIGRYTLQVATLTADGHTAPQTPGALLDQRKWIDAADRRDWTHEFTP